MSQRKKQKPKQAEVSPPAAQPVLPAQPSGLLSPSYLIPVYIFVIIAAFVFLHNGYGTIKGNEMSRERALFAAVNAATLSGFQQSTNVNDYTPAGKIVMLGVTIAGIGFSFIAGGTAVARIAKLKYSDGRIAFFSVMSVAVVVVFFAAPLKFLVPRMTFFDAIFEVVSAFGNSGLESGAKIAGPASSTTFTILMPLAIAGGLGVTVLMELVDWLLGLFGLDAAVDSERGRGLSIHARQVLIWTGGLFVGSLVLLIGIRWPANAGAAAWPAIISRSVYDALNVRTSGFAFLPTSESLIIWAMMGLMILGANSAGTGGGLKITTLATLFRGTKSVLAGKLPGRMVGIALVWLGIYLTLIAVTQLMLLSSDSQISGDRLLFLSISALGNVGLSHDPVAISNSGLMTLSATMLAGRVVPVLVLWWAADTVTEESEAVG